MPKTKCDCGHSCQKPNYCEGCERSYCNKCWEAHTVDVRADSKGQPMSVELHEAFVWDCEDCGCENVVHPIPRTDSGKCPRNNSAETIKIAPGRLVSVPIVVTCKECGASFLTECVQ